MSKFSYDCSKCAAFCCIALGYEASDQFPYTKPQNEPCKNLDNCNRCTIHDDLEAQNYHGCIAFSCHGAGPHLTQCYSRLDWQNDPILKQEVYDKFHFLRAVFEIAETTELTLKNSGLTPKALIKDFFKMIATRQKIPPITNREATDQFTEIWEQKLRAFIHKNK
ncbi:hypothetical protein [Terasakiella pusilla]|uniref:hypothetical protein n=1 Tax=Terasakiella pusilla TaxID=64973 RepID=UPI000691D771|nr:hypothetical protein [Terasakiella pusilla]